jgi:hypothetical protein
MFLDALQPGSTSYVWLCSSLITRIGMFTTKTPLT